MTPREETLTDLLDLLLHTNATIRLHNRATDDCLPLLPNMLIAALAGMPPEQFPSLAERTRATIADALYLAESTRPIIRRHTPPTPTL